MYKRQIVQDMLVLYEDDCLQEESRKMVEDHIAECQDVYKRQMDYKINVNFDRFEEQLKVVDAHTMGEFCRILVGGIPEPQGNTMIEKKKWLEENCDYIRTALMLEPRCV